MLPLAQHRFARLLCAVMLVPLIGGCRSTTIAPADAPSDASTPTSLPTELAFTSVLARVPMQDTARVASVPGGIALVGLLNQTAPCFSLATAAARTGNRVAIRMTATEAPGTCATFAAGAFDYDVGVKGLAPGSYEVEVVHRVVRKDGSVSEKTVGARRIVIG